MTLPAAREQETTQQPGDIIVGAPAASKVSMPPSDPTQMVNHQLVPAAGTYQIDPAHTFVDFTAQNLVVGHVCGRFTQLAGQIIRRLVCHVIASISSAGRLRRLRRRGPAALGGRGREKNSGHSSPPPASSWRP
jgi:hypothetical protein